MKVLTKEWLKEMEYQELIATLDCRTNKKIPFVFINGGAEVIAKENLHTVKTNFHVTENENQISFVMIPDTFEYYSNYSDTAELEISSAEDDFLSQYVNRLRIISYLPDDILKLVKDKRMLALGYAESKVKKAILKYCKGRYNLAFRKFEKSSEASLNAASGLTIHAQLIKHKYINSLTTLFDEATISEIETVGDSVHITIDDDETIILSGASVLEQECDIQNVYVRAMELHKSNDYELHLLLREKDENLVDNFYYATYAFKDMKFKD